MERSSSAPSVMNVASTPRSILKRAEGTPYTDSPKRQQDYSSRYSVSPRSNDSGPGQFECPVCSKSFRREWIMLFHLSKMHTRADGSITIPCSEKGCSRTFSRRTAMISHVDIDHINRPRQHCRYCGFGFSYTYNLEGHEEKCGPRTPAARIAYLRRHHDYVTPRPEVMPDVTPPPPQVLPVKKKSSLKPPRTEEEIRLDDTIDDLLRLDDTHSIAQIGDNWITVYDLRTLDGRNWLNDVVIDCYLTLQKQKLKSEILIAHPFFYRSIVHPKDGYSYSNTFAKTDDFTVDWIFFPLHVTNNHWALIVVDIRARLIEYADSLACDGMVYMRGVEQFLLDDEARVGEANDRPWRLCDRAHSVPQQSNGYDCGVFMCMIATEWMESIENGLGSPHEFRFRSHQAAAYRKSMMREFVQLCAPSETKPEQQTSEGV